MLGGMLAPIAEILAGNGAIHQAREEVVYAAVSEEQPGRGVPFPSTFCVKAMLFSPLLAPVNSRYWRVEK